MVSYKPQAELCLNMGPCGWGGWQGFFSKVVKVDLDDFSTVEILDLSHKDQSLRGFMGGFAYGKYAMLVPYSNGRVETNWQVGAGRDSRSIYPLCQDVQSSNSSRISCPHRPTFRHRRLLQGRAEFGTVVRVDVNDFRLETIKTLDLTTVKRQQVDVSGQNRTTTCLPSPRRHVSTQRDPHSAP